MSSQPHTSTSSNTSSTTSANNLNTSNNNDNTGNTDNIDKNDDLNESDDKFTIHSNNNNSNNNDKLLSKLLQNKSGSVCGECGTNRLSSSSNAKFNFDYCIKCKKITNFR